MIIVECEQGSSEWFAARVGIPTASRFDCIVTSKGEGVTSAKRKDYLHELIGERYCGSTEDHYVSGAMERGKMLEPEARRWYEMATGQKVERVGFIYGDKSKAWGCSPDGITVEGGIEVKCPLRKQHVAALLRAAKSGKPDACYVPQIQGAMWITQRSTWDFVLFTDDRLPSMILTVQRDDKVCDALAKLVPEFVEEVKEGVDKLRKI
jgi:hypothetical protein